MRTFITILVAMTLAVSCTDSNKSNYSLSEEATDKNSRPVILTEDNVVDLSNMNSLGIGDVESQMVLRVVLDESSYGDNIEHTEILNKRKRVALASATISAPYPESFNAYIYNSSADNFPGHAYRGTVKLYVDDKEVESFSYITGNKAKTDVQIKIFDIMPHFEKVAGNTYLIRAECTIEFYQGTDETTLTLDSPAPAGASPTIRTSNPFRVTFK